MYTVHCELFNCTVYRAQYILHIIQNRFDTIMLQNEEVCGCTIYSSSEASEVNHIIHLSLWLRWIMICFQRGRSSSWKHGIPCTSELCNYISYQVEMVRAQSTIISSLEASLPLFSACLHCVILPQLFCHVASSWHDFCANNDTSRVTCLRWRESWLCYHFPMYKLK